MKILVPVDGSGYSMKAVETAIEMAKAGPSEVMLLSVILNTSALEWGPPVSDKLRTLCEDALSKAKTLMQEKGITPHTMLSTGISPADGIIRTAKEGNFDMIVIGSRGLTGLKKFLLGGTASKVVTYAPCSVLVVKIPEAES
ncbi:MAG TPA: universal stress protein [Syntrophaceae bacterium]|nr:universal stress protein [Syntrophaceae bacterium]